MSKFLSKISFPKSKFLTESTFILLFLLMEFFMKISMFAEHFNKNSIFSSQKIFLENDF